MSSFVFMKILESTPERYDRGIQVLSRGRIEGIYERISETVAGEGKMVLDIGCGTGNVSLACAAKGATVVGIDINSGMLEIAEQKAIKAGLSERTEFLDIGVAEMRNRFEEKTMDACVSCLAFSELSSEEQSYAISAAYSILKPGGVLIIADEVTPRSFARRVVHALTQAPIRFLAYILTQSTTRPVDDLTPKLRHAEFTDIEITRTWGDSFMIARAHRGASQ